MGPSCTGFQIYSGNIYGRYTIDLLKIYQISTADLEEIYYKSTADLL